MKVIGLTGGIGSGKTTVARFFEELGAPVFIADTEAKFLMENSDFLRLEIIKNFGEQAYIGNKPNRSHLASVVFKNQKKLEVLNGIIHPAVKERFSEWKQKQTFAYVIYESAILFEKGGYRDCDSSILITAPKEVRIQRLIERDESTLAEIEARMDKQWTDSKKKKLADYVIENIDLIAVREEVQKLHHHFVQCG